MKKLENLLNFEDFKSNWKEKEPKKTKRTEIGLDVIEENKLNENVYDMMLLVDDEPTSFKEFYEINTSPDVEQLDDSDWDSIKNLEIDQTITIGGGASGETEIKRIK